MDVLRRLARCSRYLWALPTSLPGLLFLPTVVFGGRARIVRGVVEIHGPAVSFFLRRCTLLRGGAAAMTLGHVVLGCDQPTLDRTRAHERVHVRQAERWGPLFLPAYLLASALIYYRGGNAYLDNPFEREAFDRTR